MAAPVVVLFLAAALWPKAATPGALACLWLAIFSIPFTLTKSILADAKIHFLPANLENPMVFAGAYVLIAAVVVIVFSCVKNSWQQLGLAAIATALILWLAAASPSAIALVVLIGTAVAITSLMLTRRAASQNLWDHSMLKTERPGSWHANLWL